MENAPEISVIVTCYDRHEFLLSALLSVSRQDFPRERYEVIVVKNYGDHEIDSFSASQGYISIITETDSQGGLASEGVKASRGRVLTFLDDDDQFHEAKLSTVARYFSDDSVIFYHNSHSLIDESGESGTGYKLKPPAKPIVVTITGSLDFRRVLRENRLYHLGTLYFNLSSISVLRDVAVENTLLLSKMKSRPDDFIFFASLRYPGKTLVMGHEELTRYREHTSASNPQRTSDMLINLKKRHIMGSEIIAEMLAGSPFEFLARSQLIIARTDLFRLNHDLKGYLGSAIPYFRSQRMSNFPAMYIATSYLLGLFEAGRNPIFRRLRSVFLSMVGDIRS